MSSAQMQSEHMSGFHDSLRDDGQVCGPRAVTGTGGPAPAARWAVGSTVPPNWPGQSVVISVAHCPCWEGAETGKGLWKHRAEGRVLGGPRPLPAPVLPLAGLTASLSFAGRPAAQRVWRQSWASVPAPRPTPYTTFTVSLPCAAASPSGHGDGRDPVGTS